jgi:arylsulfatase A-like enzyme
MPKSFGTVAEVLKQNGYNTSWYGKNHNVPDWQSSQAGPFDLWPTGLGFEYFYGFIGGDTDQWHPALFDGTKPISPPDDPKYHLDTDLADHAVTWIRQQRASIRHADVRFEPNYVAMKRIRESQPARLGCFQSATQRWAIFAGYSSKTWIKYTASRSIR